MWGYRWRQGAAAARGKMAAGWKVFQICGAEEIRLKHRYISVCYYYVYYVLHIEL